MFSLSGQYDPPQDYGIENPLGPRTHNWKGGPLDEGSLYHGPVYTRPMYKMPWAPRPLNGAEDGTTCAPNKGLLFGMFALGIGVGLGVAIFAETATGRSRR